MRNSNLNPLMWFHRNGDAVGRAVSRCPVADTGTIALRVHWFGGATRCSPVSRIVEVVAAAASSAARHELARSRSHEGLSQRLIPSRTDRHHEDGDGWCGREPAPSGVLGACAIDRREHPAHRAGGRDGSEDLGTARAIGTATHLGLTHLPHTPSFRGTPVWREPAIHNHDSGLWIPGPAPKRARDGGRSGSRAEV